MQKKRSFLTVVLICLGAFLGGGEAEASTVPHIKPVESLETLVSWYESESGGESAAMLTDDLLIDVPLVFSETDTIRQIGAPRNVICVESGGVLVLDNPKLVLEGPKTVVIVKNGGQLQLKRGAIYTGPGQAISVEKGAEIIRQAEFQMFGGEIYNEDEEGSTTEPPTNTLPPEQEGKYPITNVIGNRFDMFCSVGKPLKEYPETMTVAYKKQEGVHGQVTLPIYWQLDSVDFETPGTYEAAGSFAKEDLEEQGLTNPENLGAVLRITVQRSQPIDSMTGRFVRIGAQGNALVQLKLPALPEDAKALYLYRSTNGVRWEQVSGREVQSEFIDFLPYSQQQGLYCYVAYRYQSDYQDIWMKVKVVGSGYEGFSNAVCIPIPDGAGPGTVVAPGSDPEDGSFDGNRGGGGQQETERVVPTDTSPATSSEGAKASSDGAKASPDGAKAESEKADEESERAEEGSVAGTKSDEGSKPVSKTKSDSKGGSMADLSDTQQESRGIWTVAAVSLGVLVGAALIAVLVRYKKK